MPGGKLRVWLVLGRVSNLPTVWSNCLAGCWLGGGNTPGAVLLLCFGASLLYTGGMFLNDACDVDFDAEFRRERPIVSGVVNRRVVIIAAGALFFLGVISIAVINPRSGVWALGLTTLIIVYDWTHKRIRTAPLLMAGCRALLFITASSTGLAGLTPRALAFAFALGIYVAGVSYLARGESRPAAISRSFWLLLFAPIVIALSLDFSLATLARCLPLVLCLGSAGRSVSLLLAGIVLVDLVATAPTAPLIIAGFLGLFGVTLLFQKYTPAT
jgi:hypothetical protein